MAAPDIGALVTAVDETQASSISAVPSNVHPDSYAQSRVAYYDKIITSLLSENESLEREIDNRKRAKLTNEQIDQVVERMLHIGNGDISGDTTAKRQQTHQKSQEVAELSALTGIQFENTEVRTSTKQVRGRTVLDKRFTVLRGHSRGVPFVVTFHVEESSFEILDLEVTIGEDFAEELNPMVQQVISQRSPQLFFTQLARYTSARCNRAELFEYLMSRYTENVTAPFGAQRSNAIYIQDGSGLLHLTLNWAIGFRENGDFYQSAHLLPTVSLDYRRLEKDDNISGQVATQFENLVREKGLTSAIDIMIESLL